MHLQKGEERIGKPVRNVEMMVVVVISERRHKFLKFHVDDDTAYVLLGVHKLRLEFFNAMALEQAEEVQLGRLMRLQGRVIVYNA
ncbi:hypothetical protein SUGI_1472850 [Cryptomeria japonica]|uniref:Uncharacterized protein n=1 Tax=Cryptomeria japonica TaxID=3369 RepID=A0AAD3NRP8_CRYJA|nr:hypothetical protein SUGI_1465850 [Cryptomeria japonica]GLJ58741.1 hypothetical protein SUGI_1472850 [Cryptomeria japonica]